MTFYLLGWSLHEVTSRRKTHAIENSRSYHRARVRMRDLYTADLSDARSDMHRGKSMQRRRGLTGLTMFTHQWIPRFPPKLPTQKLNHSLKVIGETVTLKKFCFIIGAFPTALKRTTTTERKRRTPIDMSTCVSRFNQSVQFRDGRTDGMPCEPFVGSFFL